MPTNALTIGMKLRRLRLKQGYSQEHLAERAGLHPTYSGQVERGEKNITVESLSKIAEALEVPMGELFDDVQGNFSDANYPRKAYELFCRYTEAQQEGLYRILQEIGRLL